MLLEITNQHVRIQGMDRAVMRELDELCSYKVEGYWFDPRFKRRVWDGKEHLLKFHRTHGYRVPTGMLVDILDALDTMGEPYEVEVNRTPPPALKLDWNPEIEPRPYQRGAVAAVCHPGSGLTEARIEARGSGIIKLPIRSGKTLTAAHLASQLGTTAIFLVPSQLLLRQTREALTWALGRSIGQIGEGVWNPEDITVASLQTLTANRGKSLKASPEHYRELVKRFGLVVFDECHHLTGDQWRKVMQDFDARYRVGLSATAYLNHAKAIERGVIWLKACAGPIVIDVSTSRLIEEGYLVRPHIRLWKCTTPEVAKTEKWSGDLQDRCVYKNDWRNAKVVELALEHVRAGRRTLVASNRKEQVELLRAAIADGGVDVEPVTGEHTGDAREEVIGRFTDGTLRCLVGTVFTEGVDIPELDVVINAEGGKDPKATMQRLRNLTPAPGKEKAWVDDFVDLTSTYHADHSRERLKLYRSESAFRIEVMKAQMSLPL
jgi:superfamily II DNA or RNA helicase